MATQQVAPVTCSTCAATFTAPVQSIIDGQNTSQKSAFLQGRINVVQCPQCGAVNQLTVPLLYYDLGQELAMVFMPNGLQLTNTEQEKVIGKLTNSLVDNLPAEQRKYYLLNPKQFLTLDSLVKAVLEADGITEEVLKSQAEKVRLLEEFIRIGDEASLIEKIKENDAGLDREFFEILTASMQAAQLEGNEAGAQALFALRAFLSKHSTQGIQAVAEIDAELGIVYLRSHEELLEKLQNAKNDEEFENWVAAGHALLDYSFFQKLTAQIDAAAKAADTKTVQDLKDLRSKVLEVKGSQEEQSRAALQKAADLLRKILQSSDPAQVLEKHLDHIDEAFFAILSANIQEARRQKQDQVAQAMEYVGNLAMSMLGDRLTPDTPTDQPLTEKNQTPVRK